MNRNILLLVVGFVVGFIASFLYVNSQYQAGDVRNTNNQEQSVEQTEPNKAASTSTAPSKTGALEAFGAKKSDSSTENNPPAESVYKNIQVLKGLPSDQVLTVMKAFNEGLGVKCTHCHVSTEELSKDDKPEKQTARKMLEMVRQMNKSYPTNGQVTCYTCHRGSVKPVS